MDRSSELADLLNAEITRVCKEFGLESAPLHGVETPEAYHLNLLIPKDGLLKFYRNAYIELSTKIGVEEAWLDTQFLGPNNQKLTLIGLNTESAKTPLVSISEDGKLFLSSVGMMKELLQNNRI